MIKALVCIIYTQLEYIDYKTYLLPSCFYTNKDTKLRRKLTLA